MTDCTLARYGRADLPAIRQILLDVHADAHAAEMDGPFHQTEKFAWFVDHWGARPSFDCVIAFDTGQPSGFAYGATASLGRETWRGHLSPTPAPGTTFACPNSWSAPSGAAPAPPDDSTTPSSDLGPHPEQLTTLLVDTIRPRVQALYETWGYRKIGERRPFPDSPSTPSSRRPIAPAEPRPSLQLPGPDPPTAAPGWEPSRSGARASRRRRSSRRGRSRWPGQPPLRT